MRYDTHQGELEFLGNLVGGIRCEVMSLGDTQQGPSLAGHLNLNLTSDLNGN